MESKYQETFAQLTLLKESYGEELLHELITIFSDQKKSLVTEWNTRTDLTDEELKHSAHKIKSSARNVGAFAIGDILQEIERFPRQTIAKEQIRVIEIEFHYFIETYNEWKYKKGIL